MEEPAKTDDVPIEGIDDDLLIQSPSVSPEAKGKIPKDQSSSVEELDLDSIMVGLDDEEAEQDVEAPFKEMSSPELAFDSEEDLLQDESPFIEDAFLEVEKNTKSELEAIAHWLKELEKQRTSTIEKNMMEIFEEFKKGVDEKIGQEDFDTRYNLGIAYKEMGLLEEAIHEFLISAKHPSKFFDSAGLLGMSFREKGMFGEAINWFEKALAAPDRRTQEYLAIKYELVITLKLKEDFRQALRLTAEILKEDPNYRDGRSLFQELRSIVGQ
jgi:tetratricopeptide (TPR) repeat protein